MTELWLVRHGQTDWNLEGRYQGQSDIPLNAAGLEQARQLAERLSVTHFEALYSSDLQRAFQTAAILGERLGLAVQADQRLREIHQGEWQGRLLAEIQQQYAGQLNGVADPMHARAPQGESVAEVAFRMAAAADDICHTHPQGRLLVVGHGLALATLVCQAGGIPLAQVYEHIPQNTQVEVISWPGIRFSDHSHAAR
jgi:probable phosphoglycerate mutase